MLRFMRSSRLRNQADFQSVFAKPDKVTHYDLLALYRPNQMSLPRLGIIIKKQHVKLSHDRNRIRRIIRESFRHYQDMLNHLDIIVMLRSTKRAYDTQQLRDDIEHLWPRLAVSPKQDSLR